MGKHSEASLKASRNVWHRIGSLERQMALREQNALAVSLWGF